jgi:hypothetical protein
MTSHSQVCSDHLIILHFILESLDPIGSPACLLYQYIQSFIDDDNVTYEEVMFNFGDIKKHVAHQVTMEQLLHRLSLNPARRVIVFLTNHSNDLTGDLYVSPDSSALVSEVSL